jgi:signal transduction histidine kinase
MRSTQLKLALIFIVSMVAVVVTATVVTLGLISQNEPRRMLFPLSRSIAMELERRSGKVERPPPHDRMEIRSTRPVGQLRPDLTEGLKENLERNAQSTKVEVIERAPGDIVAVLPTKEGKWMVFEVQQLQGPPLPGPVWTALWAWLGIMLLGVSGVAFMVARRTTMPLSMVEDAVASIGPDGVLPQIPVKGGPDLRRMAQTLNALSDRLKGTMESRMRLVAAAGHDLRTPMTRMRLRAEFLPDEDRTAWLSDLDELEAIADSAIRLVKEEGAGEDRERLEFDALLRETASDLQASHLPVSLRSMAPASVRAGPLALRRALRNLITNAATHGGGARVSLTCTGDEALLVIEDDGPGIPEPLIPLVFEPFFRADPARMQTVKGAGLGLAIAREIIERFGGAIEISNRPEGGLRQLVRLPLVA